MILDSLRYWVTEMHVDGFRFDLAATLGREMGGFASTAAFFELVDQDPVLSQVKLIAEPWDVNQADSYDLGRFPAQWSEWNGRFRDTVRDFWRSKDGTLGDLATRVSGSADLFGGTRRRPSASVNLVTTHDGFTLRDLVSYDTKHNEANGEESGTDDNRSWNCGVEGPTDDPDVVVLRARQSRAMLATLLLSLGVPMLLGGDEFGRTQGGNNNAYCLDTPVSWFDWSAVDQELLTFTTGLVALRRAHPALRRRRYLTGAVAGEVGWFTPAGMPMTADDWNDPLARALAVVLDGDGEPDRDADGLPLVDDDLLLLVNGWWEPLPFTLPPPPGSSSAATGDGARAVPAGAAGWRVELDTHAGTVWPADAAIVARGGGRRGGAAFGDAPRDADASLTPADPADPRADPCLALLTPPCGPPQGACRAAGRARRDGACRPSEVHSAKTTSPTSRGSTQCASRVWSRGGGAAKGWVARASGASLAPRSASIRSVNPVPTPPANSRPVGPFTPSTSEPIPPARRPCPGRQPATTTSCVRRCFTLRQSGDRRPGRYAEARRLATTPSRPCSRLAARTSLPGPGNLGGTRQLP